MKKYIIKDNVCTPYKLILNRVGRFLDINGWEKVSDKECADVHIVGCCGAFKSLGYEALGLIKEAKGTGAKVIVFGCLTKVFPEEVGTLAPDQAIGAGEWERLGDIVSDPSVSLEAVPYPDVFAAKEEYRLYDPGKRFILIQTGCSSDCPYCPHKLGIGELKSRPFAQIIEDVRNSVLTGAHTIILHGNDTGSYGTDLGGPYFPDLIKKVLEIAPAVHLTQVNADWAYEYKDVLFGLLTRENKIKDFQVLIQTTSDRLLSMMKRRPVVLGLYDDLKKLKRMRPDIVLRTDIMVGFPTASGSDEKETLEYVVEIFDEVAVHAFERFPHAKIEKIGVQFYPQEEINKRLYGALEFLSKYPDILVHRGGQVYKTLIEIEKPKELLRSKKNEQ
ncbi:MAG: radical SAM protein [Candidatus Omnitrophica bacterium]|nr:radical SAM protein [Candidatus Omnitrophota bacterium]